MGTNTLDLHDADDIIIITVRKGEVEVKSSIDTGEEFFHLLNIVADMAEDYYPEKDVDNLH